MSTNVNGYTFDGPYPLSTTLFNNVPGVYLVSDLRGAYIDVGETDSLKNRLSSHVVRTAGLKMLHNRLTSGSIMTLIKIVGWLRKK